MKILIIRLGAIGDVIMTTPIVKAIKNKYPSSHITYVVGNWASDVLKNNPNIDRLIIVEEEIFLKKKIKYIKMIIHNLRSEHFDYGLVLDKSWLFNIFIFLCGVKRRYGFSREHHLINRFLLTNQVRFLGEKKEYEYYSDILYTSLGFRYNYKDMNLYPTKEEQYVINQYMKGYKWKFIGIAPGGASNPGQIAFQKRWPKKHYHNLISSLLSKGRKVFILGGPGDKHYNKFTNFEDYKNYYNLTGVFNIREVYYLLKKYCSTFIGHDTGTTHLAAAAKVKKIITLFGPTPYHRFAPKNSIILIPPNYNPSYTIKGVFKNNSSGLDDIQPATVLRYI